MANHIGVHRGSISVGNLPIEIVKTFNEPVIIGAVRWALAWLVRLENTLRLANPFYKSSLVKGTYRKFHPYVNH